jgi:H+/Cl- antiporter ClcA
MVEGGTAQPDARNYLVLIGLAALIGIPAALVAALFLAFVHQAETWLWTDLPHALGCSRPPWYLVVGLPLVGAGIVAVARAVLPGDGGHSPLVGIGGGVTPWRFGPGIALAAVGTLAFGAVLGPEAPLIALGSVVGMVAVSLVKVSQKGQIVLATAGSFSAISALFGGPLVAGFLLLEGGVDQGAALLPALIPGLVAAAVGYVLFIGLGNWSGLAHAGLTEPGLPLYHGTHITDLLLALVVGVVTAAAIVATRRGAAAVAHLARGHWAAVLLAGGAAVGLVAQVARLLGASSQDVLFSGQSSVPSEVAQTSVVTLLVLLVAKAIGYGISLGCGFRGGPVFPAIFLGVAVASFAHLWFGTSSTWAVAVGAAAGMAAGTRLVFAALLFSGLLVGTNGVDTIPAAVFAVVAAWLTGAALDQLWPDRFAPAPSATPP